MAVPKLTGATVTRRDDAVVLTWDVDGDLEDPALSPWLLSVMLVGGENGPIHQVGFRFRDGKVEERFIFDFVETMNYYTPQVEPQRTGKKWSAVFPVDEKVSASGSFTAALSFDEPDNANETNVEGTF